jgi:hypothetical protein
MWTAQSVPERPPGPNTNTPRSRIIGCQPIVSPSYGPAYSWRSRHKKEDDMYIGGGALVLILIVLLVVVLMRRA